MQEERDQTTERKANGGDDHTNSSQAIAIRQKGNRILQDNVTDRHGRHN